MGLPFVWHERWSSEPPRSHGDQACVKWSPKDPRQGKCPIRQSNKRHNEDHDSGDVCVSRLMIVWVMVCYGVI